MNRLVGALIVIAVCAACGDGSAVRSVLTVDGVKILSQHDAGGGDDALIQGVLTTIDGCLGIGRSVVIWDSRDVDRIEGLVADPAFGRGLSVSASGGGASLNEEGELPAVVVAECPQALSVFRANEGVAVESP